MISFNRHRTQPACKDSPPTWTETQSLKDVYFKYLLAGEGAKEFLSLSYTEEQKDKFYQFGLQRWNEAQFDDFQKPSFWPTIDEATAKVGGKKLGTCSDDEYVHRKLGHWCSDY
jgi:hypothetical protein